MIPWSAEKGKILKSQDYTIIFLFSLYNIQFNSIKINNLKMLKSHSAVKDIWK